MRIHQRKKRTEVLAELPVEPNQILGDVKPSLELNTTVVDARKANRAQALQGMKLHPAMQKTPLRTAPYMRARHQIMQPRPGF
jgi:hypothetical protein